MINIIDKHNCCGCSACAQRCPKQCITMQEDDEGFLYPLVDANICIDCGLCEKICPVLNQTQERKPLECYAAKNPDEMVRAKSSSGGIFTPLATAIIKEGGVVFGAKYNDNWEVVHASAQTLQEIDAFRGSKYVQSATGTVFIEAEKYLKQGRKVMFSGTPCQIAGLKKYLRKDYPNLIAVEIVCHGVPSPLVWREYLASNFAPSNIKSINFRDKRIGWKSYGMCITTVDNKGVASSYFQRSIENSFMQLYLKHLILRPSCSNCPSKSGKSGADIILGDFWGVTNCSKKFTDDKGTSAFMALTNKGIELFSKLDVEYEEYDYTTIVSHNPSLENSTEHCSYSEQFWKSFSQNGYDDSVKLLKKLQPSFWDKFIQRVSHRLSHLKIK